LTNGRYAYAVSNVCVVHSNGAQVAAILQSSTYDPDEALTELKPLNTQGANGRPSASSSNSSQGHFVSSSFLYSVFSSLF